MRNHFLPVVRSNRLNIGASKKTGAWPPVRASILTGHAEFDGMVIESDSITNPRQDRVLPVMEEEQVFMCRQMLPLLDSLPPGALALDIGTGSGVFALWAARRGFRVLAIDINPRAIRVARENAARNNVPTHSNLTRLQPGSVCFKLAKFAEGFVRDPRYAGQFDIAFLNPPYNPTCPGVRVALHANAGKDGQDRFREQIAIVPQVLNPTGVCVGSQFTVLRGPLPEAVLSARRAFGPKTLIRWCNVLSPPSFGTARFLRRQYASYLIEGKRTPDPHAVAAYVDEVARRWPRVALIHYEVSRSAGRTTKTCRIHRCFQPVATWQDRVLLHRSIVDNNSVSL